MGMFDTPIERIYKCSSCQGRVAADQLPNEEFIKLCPLCNTESLLLESANFSIGIKIAGDPIQKNMVESQENKPVNYRDIYKPEIPWWRSGEKLKRDTIKNPTNYVNEGTQK